MKMKLMMEKIFEHKLFRDLLNFNNIKKYSRYFVRGGKTYQNFNRK